MYPIYCQYIRKIVLFFRAHLFVLAPSSETSDGWAQFDRRGHVAGGLGAIRAVCRAWQALNFFWALGLDKAHPRGWCFRIPPRMVFPRRHHPPGDWVCASLRGLGLRTPGNWVPASPIPVHARKIWMQTGFFCWRVYVNFPIFAQSTTIRSCHPAAVQPPSSSSLQLYARVASVAVADCFDRSVPFVTTPYPIFLLCAAASCACL